MGLDMYLYSVPKIEGMSLEEILSANYQLNRLETDQIEIYEKVKPYIKDFREFESTWASIETEIAYWRKANQIHHWFVENIQNGIDECHTYEVTKENLQTLYHLCKKIVSTPTIEVASTLLPTKTGFFFGSIDYDKYYFMEIKRTYSILKKLLKHFNFETHYLIYSSSW